MHGVHFNSVAHPRVVPSGAAPGPSPSGGTDPDPEHGATSALATGTIPVPARATVESTPTGPGTAADHPQAARPGASPASGAADRRRWLWPEVLALTVVFGGVVAWQAGLIDLAALLPF
jgi:hypothetical protein